jgi:hypothetical protein
MIRDQLSFGKSLFRLSKGEPVKVGNLKS